MEESKEVIEAELQEPLEWVQLGNRKRCRIVAARPGAITDNQETLEEIQDWMIEKLLKFKQVFEPRLKDLS